MSIGERIKERRLQLDWSLRDLSERMGYANHSTIARIEAGKVDIPQSKIVKFAEVLNTSIAYLMGWEEDKAEEMQKKNDALANIILEMRTDDEFLSIVEAIYNMDKEKRSSLLAFLK